MSNAEPLAQQVFRILADGEFHSGATLAATLGVTRSAIWKAVGSLRALGVVVEAITRRGYRIPASLAPLDAERIRVALPAVALSRLRHGEAVWTLGSTNSELLVRQPPPPGQFDFLVAEYQGAGRGRQSRSWLAPPGGAICLSLNWSYAALPGDAGALSLAMGVAALEALSSLGPLPVGLKWPNDLLVGGRKIGGMLLELRSEGGGPVHVVYGIGLNVSLAAPMREEIARSGLEPTDLVTLGVRAVDRNQLAAALIATAVDALDLFAREGFRAFFNAWQSADVLRGKPVSVLAANTEVTGRAAGVDSDGALLVETATGLQRFISGAVSLRPDA